MTSKISLKKEPEKVNEIKRMLEKLSYDRIILLKNAIDVLSVLKQ